MLLTSVPPTPKRAIVELLIGAVLWGGSFVASKYALGAMGPLWLISIRYGLAVVLALPVLLLTPSLRSEMKLDQFSLAMMPGIFLSLTLLLGLAGLQFTTVTKSGFITVLYILFVPLLDGPLFGRKVSWKQGIWILMALVGTGLICDFQGGAWNRGDLLIFVSTLASTAQILSLEMIAHRIRSPFVFNFFQAFWVGLLPTLLVPLDTITQWPFSGTVIACLLMLSIGVTLIAFFIQVRVQRVLPASLVSMLFLLESPLAAFFAYLAFGESLSLSQWIGATLIMGAAYGSTRKVI